MTLGDMKDGSHFKIITVTARGEIRRRLVDMGFIRGVEGQVLREALLRDPIELQIKGYKVSLRRSEARQVDVEVIH